MVTSWIISFASTIAVVFPTSAVIDGVCYAYAFHASRAAGVINSIWNFLFYYVLILFIFVFCYWRIVLVIRRQARVMAGHVAQGSTAGQIQLHEIQSSVTKTMLFVSACYAVSWLPAYIHFFITTIYPSQMLFGGMYYGFSLLAYSYMCINPFIYATKLDPVRQVLLRLVPCKKTSEPAAGSAF